MMFLRIFKRSKQGRSSFSSASFSGQSSFSPVVGLMGVN
jgi:hypothetical protein